MMRVFTIALACFVAALASGCVVACGPCRSPPAQQVKLDARSPSDYRVRVVGYVENFDTQVPTDGRVTFDVPVASRHCTQYFLGIKVHSPKSVEKRRLIQIIRGDRVVRKLSAHDIAKLPADPDGYHLVEVEK